MVDDPCLLAGKILDFMAKNILFSIFYFLFFLSGFSQSTKVVFTDSTRIEADQYYGKDVLAYHYYSKKNVLYKQKKVEKWEYKNLPLGEIHSIDFINPLKIVVFYKEFNSVVLLDNQLSEITRINLSDFNIVAQTCSVASQNRLWIYDSLTNNLLLLDYLNKKITRLNQPFKNTFKYYKSDYNNWLRISENNEVFSYNNYGRTVFLGSVPKFDKILITDSQKIVFSLNDNLYLYKGENFDSELIFSIEKNIQNFDFKNGVLTIFTGKTIENYNIKLP